LQENDLDSEFGAVAAGDIEGVIEVAAGMSGAAAVHEFALRVSFFLFVRNCTIILCI
jgi:hypothetical protein